MSHCEITGAGPGSYSYAGIRGAKFALPRCRSSASMGTVTGPSTAIAMIAAMITPALLILGSASLVSSALVRMGRVMDRARTLATIAHEGAGQAQCDTGRAAHVASAAASARLPWA